MKKMMYGLLPLIVSLALLQACTSNRASPEQTVVGSSVPEAKEVVTLKMTIWGTEYYKKLIEDIGKDFNVRHPYVKLDVTLIPLNDYSQKLSIMVASKTAPDLAWMNYRIIKAYMEADQLMDITPIKNDKEYDFADHNQNATSDLTNNGILYGVAMQNAPRVLFFNKTLFKEKGLKDPLELYKEGNWTYEEMVNAAKVITDPSKGIYGINLVTQFGWASWPDTFMDTIWAYGADFLNKDGTQFVFNSPQGEKMLQFFSNLVFKDQVHPKPGDQTTFESGKIGMNHLNYSYAYTLRQNAPSLEWDIAPMPTGPAQNALAMDGFAGISVMQDSKHKQEALEFLKYFTGKEGQKSMAKLFVPNRISLLESGVLTEGNKTPSAAGVHAAIIDRMKKGSSSGSTNKNWQQIDMETQKNLDLLYSGKLGPKEVLKKMEADITPLLN